MTAERTGSRMPRLKKTPKPHLGSKIPIPPPQQPSKQPTTTSTPNQSKTTTSPSSQGPFQPLTPRPLTQARIESLQHQSALLHLLHARNRNQHRRSKWYRHFSTLRRELRRLLVATETDPLPPASRREMRRRGGRVSARSSAPDAVLLSDAQRAERVAPRLGYWVGAGLVRVWYAAFSGVVADGQFAGLGIALLGVLARICAVLGVAGVAAGEDAGRGGREDEDEDAGRGQDEDDGEEAPGADVEMEDLGVVVERVPG